MKPTNSSKPTIPGLQQFRISKPAKSKAKSCQACRDKKRGCNRQQPCSNCEKHHTECVYGDSALTLEEQAKLLVGLGSQSSIKQTPISTISSPISVSNSVIPPTATPTFAVKPYSYPGTISENGSVSSEKAYSQKSLGIRNHLELIKNHKTPESPSIEDSSPIGKAFWPTSKSCDQLSPVNRIGPVYTRILNSSIYKTGNNVKTNIKTLWSYIPDRRTAEVLLDRYCHSVHPIIPLIDLESFYPNCEAFWNDHNSADISFFIIFFTILYAASVSEFEELSFNPNIEFDKDQYVSRMKYFVGATEIALAMADFPNKITLVGLQSSIILHSVLRNDCRTDDCGSMGMLIRLAQLIELHRDPLNYHETKDQKEVQLRRIMWWFVYYLDCTTSLSSKVSPIIIEGEFDTLYPSEYLKDINGNFRLDPYIAFANGRFRWVECCNHILRQSANLDGFNKIEYQKSKSEIENLSFHCSSLAQRIYSNCFNTHHHDKFLNFSTSLLTTLADRCQILLHFASSPSTKKSSTIFKEKKIELSSTSDPEQINDAGIIDDRLVEAQIHLLNQFQKYGSMPNNMIFLWEIRKFQPIQVLLFLLKSLIVEIKSTKKSYLNFRNDVKVTTIFESIKTLGYLSEHTTPLCRDRWKLLKNLKDYTWNQLFDKANQHSLTHLQLSNSELNTVPSSLSFETSSESYDDLSEFSDKNWNSIQEELKNVQQIIDENINAKLWDIDSGHFLF